MRLPGNWDQAALLACAFFAALLVLGFLVNRG
jgi:hypothetical protein